MSRKVTISVPDDLYDQMSKWRSSFNFSKIFQQTIRGVIRKKESFQKLITDEIDLSAIVDRLKKEKQEIEKNFREIGKLDSLEWIKTAHFKDIHYVLNWQPPVNPFTDETLGEYFAHALKRDRLKKRFNLSHIQDNFHEFTVKYLDGWKEGVHDFWNEIKDKLHNKPV
jgi:hypothetical protein